MRRFPALLEDSAEELYESAPCGCLSSLMDGTVAKINATLLGWLGLERDAVVGRMRFADLLTVGGKLYHETHFAPLLLDEGRDQRHRPGDQDRRWWPVAGLGVLGRQIQQ